jgi:hypothetical protein
MIQKRLRHSRPAPFSVTASEAPSRGSDVAADWSALPGGVVDGGEIVLLAIRPSMWRPLFEACPWLVTCCVLAVILTLLSLPAPGLSLLVTTQLILLAGLARFGVAVARWASMWYVLTNRRVLDVQGVRVPRIWSCLLVETRNTYLNASSAEKLTGLGTITFVTEHPDEPPRQWRSIDKPEEVHARIRRAIENALDQHGLGA